MIHECSWKIFAPYFNLIEFQEKTNQDKFLKISFLKIQINASHHDYPVKLSLIRVSETTASAMKFAIISDVIKSFKKLRTVTKA